jgi:hypothetical protein
VCAWLQTINVTVRAVGRVRVLRFSDAEEEDCRVDHDGKDTMTQLRQTRIKLDRIDTLLNQYQDEKGILINILLDTNEHGGDDGTSLGTRNDSTVFDISKSGLDSTGQTSGGPSDASGKLSEVRAHRLESTAAEHPSLRKRLTTILRRGSMVKDALDGILPETMLDAIPSMGSELKSHEATVHGTVGSDGPAARLVDDGADEALRLSMPPRLDSLDQGWSFFNAACEESHHKRPQRSCATSSAGSLRRDRGGEPGMLALPITDACSEHKAGLVQLAGEGSSAKVAVMPEADPGRPSWRGMSTCETTGACSTGGPEHARTNADDARSAGLLLQLQASMDGRAASRVGPVAEGTRTSGDAMRSLREQVAQNGCVMTSSEADLSPVSTFPNPEMRPKHVAFRHMHDLPGKGEVIARLSDAGAFAAPDEQGAPHARSHHPWASTGPSTQQPMVRSLTDAIFVHLISSPSSLVAKGRQTTSDNR